MALEKLTQDVANISKLDNYPPDDVGMTPDKLKSLFDKGSNTIKDYINNTLLPQLEQGYVSSIARTSGDGSAGSTDTYTISFHDGTAITFDIYNGADGGQGDPGERGKSLEFRWNGTQLGVRVEGETSYQYVNLKGDKGEQGIQGLAGKNLEFNWDGTQLGIRVEGEASYQYVNLKGAKGDTGAVPNISIGTTTTLTAGSNATVNRRSGSPDTAPIFDFGIPKGLDGKDGINGIDGKDGKDAVLPFDIWAGSLAEYNALSYEQRNDPNFVHCIYEE